MPTTTEARARFAAELGKFRNELMKSGFSAAEAAAIVVAYVRGYCSRGSF